MEDIPGMRVAVKKSLLMLGQEHIERECVDEATGQPGPGLGLAWKRLRNLVAMDKLHERHMRRGQGVQLRYPHAFVGQIVCSRFREILLFVNDLDLLGQGHTDFVKHIRDQNRPDRIGVGILGKVSG